MMCPAAVAAESPDGAPVAVQFPPPSASGGIAAAHDHLFSGSGLVVFDRRNDRHLHRAGLAGRTATCTVPVTVTRTPTLPATRFLAFGDSITAGEISFNATMLLVDTQPVTRPTWRGSCGRAIRLRTSTWSTTACRARLAVQGNSRISGSIVRNNAQVLLLLEGVNDLQQQGEDGINEVIEALKFDIRDGVRRGCTVFISTLLPEKDGFRASAKELISPTNDKIRDSAAREGVVLVDSWQVFAGKEATLIGQDGLHPTVEGYQVLAQAFFDAIQGHLEQKLRLSRLRR